MLITPFAGKTLIYVDSQKGGAGKSMTAMALLEFLRRRQGVRAYDYEGIDGDLAVRYQAAPVQPDRYGDLSAYGDPLNVLLDPAAGVDIAIVDQSLGLSFFLPQLFQELGIGQLVQQGALRVCCLWVCGDHYRSFLRLRSAIDLWAEQNIHIKDIGLVVNDGLSQGGFDIIADMPVVKNLLDLGVHTIRLPSLNREPRLEAENHFVTFDDYIRADKLDGAAILPARRQMAKTWLDRCSVNFRRVPFLADLLPPQSVGQAAE